MIENQINRKDAFLAAAQMESLPSARLLRHDATPDQRQEWQRLRERQFWISKCWKARFSGKLDPLEELSISKKIKDEIWDEVDCLRSLWELIQEGWTVIKTSAKKDKLPFPFQEPVQLFVEAVRAEVDYCYRFCLRPYQEVSTKKIGKDFASTIKSLKNHHGKSTLMTIPEERKARDHGFHKELNTHVRELQAEGVHDWALLSIFLCGEACRAKPATYRRLQDKLDDLDRAEERILKRGVTATRRRGEWEDLIHPSFAWINGKRVYTAANGTYRA